MQGSCSIPIPRSFKASTNAEIAPFATAMPGNRLFWFNKQLDT